MKPALKTIATLAVLSAFAGGCSFIDKDDAPPLEGERISVLELQEAIEPADAALEVDGLITPEPWRNEFWPQAGGYPNHSMQNLDLNTGELSKVWSTDIGQGGDSEIPLTVQPVVVDGKVFTMDTESVVSAIDVNTGKTVWKTNAGDPDEDDPVIGGGLAYSAGALYVTNGFHEVLALNPTSGEIVWRKTLSAPSRAAPTIMDGRLFVTTLDNRLLAMNARDGSVLWEYVGVSEAAGLVGAASPAASRDIVVPAFSSGDVAALRVENGSVAWMDNLSGIKRFGGLSGISDIKALPVIDRGMIIAISFGGRMVAIDERTGARIWQREIGSDNTPWMAGNHVFVLTSDNQIVALGRDTGAIRWVMKVENTGDKPVYFSGPVLAGGRLFLAGTEGIVMEIDPENGETIRKWDAGSTISIPPVVAGGTLYLLSEDGTLSAYK